MVAFSHYTQGSNKFKKGKEKRREEKLRLKKKTEVNPSKILFL